MQLFFYEVINVLMGSWERLYQIKFATFLLRKFLKRPFWE